MMEVAALRTRCLLANDVTQAYACLPLAHVVECRADKQVVLDDNFIPTVLHAAPRAGWPRSRPSCSGCFISAAKRWADGWRRPARGGAAEIAEFLMLQAINRYEPLLAHFADSGALHPGGAVSALRVGGGRARDVHHDSKRPPAFPGYRHDRLARVVRAGHRIAARLAERRTRPERHTDTDRAQEVRDQRCDRHPTGRYTARRCSFWRRAPTCRPKSCAGVFRRSSRSARSRKSPTSCALRIARRAGACRFQRRPGRSRFTPGTRISSWIRTPSCGDQLEELGRRRAAHRRRVSGPDDGVLGDPELSARVNAWRTTTIRSSAPTRPRCGRAPGPASGDRTRRPRTPGVAVAGGPSAEPIGAAARDWLGVGLNPLLQAASPLLLLAGQLRGAISAMDVAGLRQHALDEMRRFEDHARAAGVRTRWC